MNIDITKEETLRRYLLDECTEDEQLAVEERFIKDDGLFDEMLAYEDELYLEYSAGELSDKEKSVFEQKFLRNRDDRTRLAFADSLLETTADMAHEKGFATASEVETKPSLLQSIASFFSFGSALQFGLASAAVLLFVGVIGLLVQNSRMRNEMARVQQQTESERQEKDFELAQKQKEQQDIENQLATEREKNGGSEERIRELESERQKLENEIRDRRRAVDQRASQPESVRQPTLATLVISPGLFTRSDGQPMNRVHIAPTVSTLKLRLTLKNVDEYEKFGAVVSSVDNGVPVLDKTNIKAAGRGANRSLTLNIPNRSLHRADYQVSLTGTTKTGQTEPVTKYYFSVDK